MTSKQYTAEMINVIDLRKLNLSEALAEIERRPTMWLAKPNITCLSSFINGWIVGRNKTADEKLLLEFNTFVATKFNESSSTIGWCNMIIKHYGQSDEEDTLQFFFNLFREFTYQLSLNQNRNAKND